MMGIDDLAALRAAAGDARSARNLRQIMSLCDAAPTRVAAHAGRLAFMERVLTTSSQADAPFVDWLGAWAQAHMTLHSAVGRFNVDGSRAIVFGGRTAGALQLLDAALVAAADGCAPGSITAGIALTRIGEGVSIRMDCAGGIPEPIGADAVVAMAISAGLPAAWRFAPDCASIAVLVDLAWGPTVAGRA